ncbi:DUF72 domain-containing protein [Candidatus Methylocalor cossyra]|uniref:DUF72 domain-containing protein n=1 Tax=Candidatus Methylocalor cossyra TaxID=3108543 RepID=A0ABP1C7Q1_9GAMM
MAAILIGTASWADRSLIDSGLFYPPSVKAADERLRYYATQFPLVEVDSSYYALPAARNAALWAARTPDGFVFDVKAFRLFTQHQTPPSALPKDIRDALEPIQKNNLYYRDLPEELLEVLWARFRSALEPLRAAGKLGVVLFQFPPWFVYRPSHLDHLLLCQRMLADYPIAVEFRHGSWFEPRRRAGVLDFERRHGLVHVVADEPQGFPASIPAIWEATAAVAVIRLHGRNRATWDRKGLVSSAERFNYLYSDAELAALASPIRTLAQKVREVHVLFNNNFSNYAQQNARRLQELVQA